MAYSGSETHQTLGFYLRDGGISKGRTIHGECNRVKVVCTDISKMAACVRNQMGLRTIFESTSPEIKNYFGIVNIERTATPRLAILGIRTGTARDRFYSKDAYLC